MTETQSPSPAGAPTLDAEVALLSARVRREADRAEQDADARRAALGAVFERMATEPNAPRSGLPLETDATAALRRAEAASGSAITPIRTLGDGIF